MSPQFAHVITTTVMTLLVAVFLWINVRNRRAGLGLWMWGWVAILIHFASSTMNSFGVVPDRLANWMAYTTLIAAASCFFHSVSGANERGTRLWMFLWRNRIAGRSLLDLPGL